MIKSLLSFLLLSIFSFSISVAQVEISDDNTPSRSIKDLMKSALNQAANNMDIPVLDEQVFDDYDIDDFEIDEDEAYDYDEEIDEHGPNEFPEELKNHPYIRYQKNINKETEAEAYPWISADGLRMFYVKDNQVFFAERGNRYEDFSDGKELDMQDNSGYISCWLTNDESHMYVTTGSSEKIYKYQRNASNRYEKINEVVIDKRVEGFVSALSFTPDGNTALLYNSPSGDGQRNLSILEVKPGGALRLRMRFKTTLGTMGVGQLSKDGKRIYFSVEENTDLPSIYRVELADLEANSPKFVRVLSLNGLRIGKPTLTYDETYLVFNACANDNWADNEIMVVDLNNLSFIEEDTSLFTLEHEILLNDQKSLEDLANQNNYTTRKLESSPNVQMNLSAQAFNLEIQKIYPNPTRDLIKVQYHIPANATIAELVLSDVQGKEIFRKKLKPSSTYYEISGIELGLAEGHYLLHLNTELGVSSSTRIVFQSSR